MSNLSVAQLLLLFFAVTGIFIHFIFNIYVNQCRTKSTSNILSVESAFYISSDYNSKCILTISFNCLDISENGKFKSNVLTDI